ncbi:MAG: hypothetical protein ACXV5I_09785 [Halobacteriota archaeon]
MWGKEPWEREPYEQFDGESDKAYGAFLTYLSVGMGNRTYAASTEMLGKPRHYESTLRKWASKYQWRSRCQAYDAEQLERSRDEAEKARLKIYADGLELSRYFYRNIGLDLKRQFEGWWPGEPTPDDPTGESERNRKPYKSHNKFTVNDKIKLLTFGFDMAERYAAAQKQLLLKQSTEELEDTAFDAAFDEIIETDPDLHDAYVRLLSEALRRSRSGGAKKPLGS